MKTLLKIYLLAGILISITNLATAQKPITWQRIYGDENILITGILLFRHLMKGLLLLGEKEFKVIIILSQ